MPLKPHHKGLRELSTPAPRTSNHPGRLGTNTRLNLDLCPLSNSHRLRVFQECVHLGYSFPTARAACLTAGHRQRSQPLCKRCLECRSSWNKLDARPAGKRVLLTYTLLLGGLRKCASDMSGHAQLEKYARIPLRLGRLGCCPCGSAQQRQNVYLHSHLEKERSSQKGKKGNRIAQTRGYE